MTRKKRGAIEGPIRIPSHSPLFLFNVLALPSISSKSLKFQSELFSIPTAPTNLLRSEIWRIDSAQALTR